MGQTSRSARVLQDPLRRSPGARRCRYVLKCDVRKYFPSIDHQILKDLLARAVKCRPTLDLAARIVDASNPQEEVVSYFPGDDLFTPFDRRRGLPLGNQTSQFFANVYLDPLDQAVNRQLRPEIYARYVDDFVVFGDSKARLAELRASIEEELCRLRLEIHPGKSRIFPERTRLVRGNVVRFRRRMRSLAAEYVALTAHGDTWKLRQQIFGQFENGHFVPTSWRTL